MAFLCGEHGNENVPGYEEDREGMQRKREGKKQLGASEKSKALRWGVLSKE